MCVGPYVKCACVHRYGRHQLRSVRKSRTLPVSDTITDIVCQVWDAENQEGEGNKTAVDILSGRVSGDLSCVLCCLPHSPSPSPLPGEKDLSLAGHVGSFLNRQVAPDYMLAADNNRQY